MGKRGWTERFRQATDLTPAGKTPILGPARCTAEEMRGYVARRNPEAPDIAGWYLAAGERYGVRGDLAFCHAVHETNAWRGRGSGVGSGVGFYENIGGVVCGGSAGGDGLVGAGGQIGGTVSGWVGYGGIAGNGRMSALEAIEQAVEAHMQRLLRFVSPERFVQDERRQAHMQERTGIYRKWTYWEDLDGVIHPARRDGSGAVAIWRRMLEWAGKGGENRMSGNVNASGVEQPGGRSLSEREAARVVGEAAPANEAELQWLMTRGLLRQPAPAPGQAVTWAELAGLLRRWEEAAKPPEQPAGQSEARSGRPEPSVVGTETAANMPEKPEA